MLEPCTVSLGKAYKLLQNIDFLVFFFNYLKQLWYYCYLWFNDFLQCLHGICN